MQLVSQSPTIPKHNFDEYKKLFHIERDAPVFVLFEYTDQLSALVSVERH